MHNKGENMKIVEMLGAQGDVLLYKIDEFPSGQRLVDQQCADLTLAYGELSGHSHTFATDGEVDVFKIEGAETSGLVFVDVKKESTLIHGRDPKFLGVESDLDYHSELKLPPGRYITGIVEETDWLTKTIRRVQD